MAEIRSTRPALIATLARRIMAFALLAMIVQVIIVFADYYFDDVELGSLIVERETAALAAGLHDDGGVLRFDLPEAAMAYRLDPATHIARIRDDDGRLLLSRKRGTSAFMQAGGKIEPGEQPAAALVRELRDLLKPRGSLHPAPAARAGRPARHVVAPSLLWQAALGCRRARRDGGR